MPLIQAVKDVCDRLGPLGWRDLLLRVTSKQLDIRQPSTDALRSALLANIATIDRDFPGFEDFSGEGRQAITPGSPAQSLLYHALASPSVTLGENGPLTAFPNLREIEAVENFVFGAQPPSLAQLRQRAGLSGSRKLSVVLFAYEYRSARDTCFGLHADLTFSRTGISRVGTRDPNYAARHRGFQSEVPDDPFAFSVCPAKFGAFLSVRRSGSSPDFHPMRPQDGDDKKDFWVPIHKLFDGAECLQGIDLEVRFKAFHYNDKIRRVQIFLKKNPPAIKPFRLTEGIADFLDPVTMGSGLISPTVHPRLVEPAELDGKFVTFRVPPSKSNFAALEPGAKDIDGAEVRPAPAYVHARTKVQGKQLIDLNNDAEHPDVREEVRKGNYDALHFLDFTGDGFIDAEIPAFARQPEVEATAVQAYSLVAAPDFFPNTGQRELTEWTQSPQVPKSLREKIWGVDPVPLCDIRLPANLQMPDNRFDEDETTVTAVVPLFGSPLQGGSRPLSLSRQRHSSLPDDAAGVFAPGWDVSTDTVKRGRRTVHHLAAYGLGSPFPEDSKLCAALSTFWATVAPDITRGMSIAPGNPELRHTVAPLTDEEIGQIGSFPWDGNPGPKAVSINGQQFAECASFLHVDYVTTALDGRFTARLMGHISAQEYERRVLAMAFAYAILGDNQNHWFVLSFRHVHSGDPELQTAQVDASAVLPGTVYRLDIFQADKNAEKPAPDFRKRLLPIFNRRFLFVDPTNRMVLQRHEDQAVWSRAVLSI